MTPSLPERQCDLLIIGSGMAGMAAAIFAAERGIDTIQVGMTSELNFATGMIDLLGVHPVAEGRIWDDPWRARRTLIRDIPRHPYALLDPAKMRRALASFLNVLAAAGLPYATPSGHNAMLLTPVGTLKPTYCFPLSMQNGLRALEGRADCLMIDFHGLKGFSGRQMVETLQCTYPRLRSRLHTARIAFPGASGECFPEHMARALSREDVRAELAQNIAPHLPGMAYVGVPAILGLEDTRLIFDDLQARLGLPLFEIPTMPPAITGLRLKRALERQIPRLGVRTHFQHRVTRVIRDGPRACRFEVGRQRPRFCVSPKAAVLATGRFFGGGLVADRKGIRETVLDLPVAQPATRSGWHRKALLDPAGHSINRAGLETDQRLRPLNAKGQPAFDNLFAAGSILAHQDWMRMKCGSGLAITTARAAIAAVAEAND